MHNENGVIQKRILVFLTIFALLVTAFAGQSAVTFASEASSKMPYAVPLSVQTAKAQTNDIGPRTKIENGSILHAWCWSFHTIKSNMKEIADAGYTSVQTSPAGACLVGNGGNKSLSNWYWHYQPTDYKVGNYQLGTESEFKAMCEEADKYGIKIIVDVVANHMTGDQNAISSNYKRISNWCHTTNEISDWNNRYQVTQLALMGMPDNNTHNKAVQNYIKNYLSQCLKLGADGFRYDAAKHIELPDDSGFGGDFWPTILNNGAQFQYGEILQDSISREAAYASYMGVTASNYGMKLRSAIGSNSLSASDFCNFDIHAAQNKTVTWVESHDNYANAITDWGSSEWMNDEQIKLAWAVIGSRKGGVPLFFSRPVGGGGCSWDNRFPGKSQIGDRGSSLFMDDEVAAVNKFRNAMEGENEYLRNPNGDTKVLMIERGTKGLVAINLNSYDYTLSSKTNLKNGSYTNQTDNNNQFTVSNGTIRGKLPARSVVVLFDYEPTAPAVAINNCPSAFCSDSVTLTLTSKNTVKATYSINGGTSYLYNNGDTVKIGSGDAYNTTYTIQLNGVNGDGVTTSQSYTIIKKEPNASTNIYFEKPSNWGNTIYAYVYDESGETVLKNANWPGAVMNYDSSIGCYKYSFKNDWSNARVIFTDNKNQTPGANETGFKVKDGAVYNQNGDTGRSITSSSTVSPSPTKENENKVTIYYRTNWSTANIHYKIGNGSWTAVPGVIMSSYDGSYKVTTIDLGSSNSLTACFNDGNGNWDSKYGTNYDFPSAGTYTVNNGTIIAGAPF